MVYRVVFQHLLVNIVQTLRTSSRMFVDKNMLAGMSNTGLYSFKKLRATMLP